MWKKFLITYITLLVSFTFFILGVHMIPKRLLIPHVLQSAQLIKTEGIFRQIGNIYLLQIDNMTDCMMMNMAITADDNHPIVSAMNNYYSCNSVDEDYHNMALNTIQLAENGADSLPERIHYGRYWQGSQIFLRPLLVITNYFGIRIINYIMLSILLVWLLLLIASNFGRTVSLLFLISLLFVGAPIVPLSIQLSVCFYLMFISSIIIMKFCTIQNSLLLFFIIGAFTSYFDFLTIPQITLGIPLIFLLLKNRVDNPSKYVIILSLSWFLGYALLWSSKWMIAYLLTGNDIVDTVKNSIMLRLSNSVVFHGKTINIYNLFNLIFIKISWWIQLIIFIFVLVIFYVYYKYQKGMKFIKDNSWLLIISFIVPLWYSVLRNHSVQHIFFTWRAILVTIFSLMLFVYCTTKKEDYHG